jgi:two-component system cell cycle sensor histidine kinase/response regulator CckA
MPWFQEEMSLLSRIIGADIKVRMHIDPDLQVIMPDPSQIEQVLMNLCLNARDAMPGGGELTIETRNVDLDARFCAEHAFDRPGSYILLSATDNGTGIDSAALDHIFEPFLTTKPTGKGTGLGLATVYGIVKQHGGFISASSRPEHGTCFRVYLPAKARQHAAPEVALRCEPPGGTETILLAEDHEGLRNTAQEMLKKLGYRVMVAADGKETVELFRSNHHEIDLVVMDVVMPLLSGHSALSRTA